MMVLTVELAGQFLWGGSDFSKTAHHIHLSGGIVLEAKLKKEDGSWSDLQGINLRDHISNQDGKLTYGKHFSYLLPQRDPMSDRLFLPSD